MTAYLALLASLISLCLGSAYAKTLFSQVGVNATVAYRVGFAALILMLAFRPWRRSWEAKDFLPLLRYGLVLGAMNYSFYLSLQYLPFAIAIAIEFCGPLAVAVYFSRNRLDFLWIALAALGLLLVLPFANNSSIPLIGIALAITAATMWALYIIFAQSVAQKYGSYATAIGLVISSMWIIPLGLFSAGEKFFNPEMLFYGLIIAIFTSAIPYSLEMFALKTIPKHTFSIFLSLEPALGVIAGWLVLKERLNLQQLLAIACILVASLGSSFFTQRSTIIEINN